jgi:hypothetical protein
MIALMWMPALASVITRLVMREGFRDVSLRIGGADGVRAIGMALLFPATVGVFGYLTWRMRHGDALIPSRTAP